VAVYPQIQGGVKDKKGASPMTFPTSALLKRELLTTLRSRYAFLMLLATTAIIFVVVGLFLYSMSMRAGIAGPGGGDFVLGAIFIGLYVAMLLCIPPMAASAIVSERTMGNYDLLMTSLIRPSGVIIGKMAHIVGVYLLLMVAVLPLVGVCYFFVGVEWQQILLGALATTVAAVAVCSFGLFASSMVQSTRAAVLWAYLLTALFQGVALLIVILILSYFRFWHNRTYFEPLQQIVTICLPGAAIVSAISPTSIRMDTYAQNLLFQGGWILLFFWLTVRRLRRPWEPATPGSTGDQVRRVLRVRGSARGRSLPSIPMNRNAMHIKELRASRLGRRWARVLLWMAVFVACLIWYYGYGRVGTLWGVAPIICIALLTPSFAATGFAKEFERQNVDMLRATLLSPLAIAWGKFRAALSMLLILYTAVLAAHVVTVYSNYLSYPASRWVSEVSWSLLIYYLQVAVLLFFGLTLGGALGARFRRTGAALVGAYLGGFVLLFIVPYIVFSFAGLILFPGTIDPPAMLFGLHPLVLLYPWGPGQEEAVTYWALFFTTLYSMGLFIMYWRAGARNLKRETVGGH
jgi:hypothetical protein